METVMLFEVLALMCSAWYVSNRRDDPKGEWEYRTIPVEWEVDAD